MSSLIVSRTPLRVSLVGGGSDLQSYYTREGIGRVISFTIDKYIYVTVHNRYDGLIRASYSKTEIAENIEDINHELIRESMKLLKIDSGIEITSISDVTAHGTGLGSSSAYTAGVLNALSNLSGRKYSRFNLANDACKVEIEKCMQPIGKQDQFASVFGGLNEITFTDSNVSVSELNMSMKNLNHLSENLLLFDTGLKRRASSILSRQKKEYDNNKLGATKKLVDLIDPMRNALLNDVDIVGEILDESWRIKKTVTSGISNDIIDNHYKIAMENGATGGKLCGAGGGGFLLFYSKREDHEKLRNSLSGMKELNFKLEFEGAKILCN